MGRAGVFGAAAWNEDVVKLHEDYEDLDDETSTNDGTSTEGSEVARTTTHDVNANRFPDSVVKVSHALTVVTVISNAFILGLEVEIGCLTCPGEAWFESDAIFTVLFLVETTLRILNEGPMNYFILKPQKEPRLCRCRIFNFVDLLLVVFRFLDLVLSVGGLPTGLKLATTVRVLRVGVAVAHVRLMRGCRELALLFEGFRNSVLIVAVVVSVLLLVAWVFATVLTVALGHSVSAEKTFDYTEMHWSGRDAVSVLDRWGTVPRSLLSLAAIISRDSWARVVVWPLVHISPWMLIPFIMFFCITNLCLMNLLTGVIVQSSLQSARRIDEEMALRVKKDYEEVTESLREMFYEADVDKNSKLDKAEFHSMFAQERVKDRVAFLDISLEDIKMLFEMLDTDNSGMVPIDKFFRCTAKLRGDAMACDSYHVSVDLKRNFNKAEELLHLSASGNAILGRLLDLLEDVDRNIIKCDADAKDPVLNARKKRVHSTPKSHRMRLSCLPIPVHNEEADAIHQFKTPHSSSKQSTPKATPLMPFQSRDTGNASVCPVQAMVPHELPPLPPHLARGGVLLAGRPALPYVPGFEAGYYQDDHEEFDVEELMAG
eukprot:TRINITY_DN68347_c0_g1_i1.p1 TRINITY_DN68347_c0_g1~~TRINITY_DN68347_c0_g1_i1.p1  ORF type:complete len:601 (-),score=96.28 TRINITY_DN68347_c0_g1_i1:254-2056(-)